MATTKKPAKKPVKKTAPKAAPRQHFEPGFLTKLKLLFTGVLCGLILGTLPMLALMITPGTLTKEYVSASILSTETVSWLQGQNHPQCR